MFTDTPTRVAPAPVQEALGVAPSATRDDSEQTPLPKPMPFHSDADDFDERAFEEATKVRSLDELAAQSAGLLGGLGGLGSAPSRRDDGHVRSRRTRADREHHAARRARRSPPGAVRFARRSVRRAATPGFAKPGTDRSRLGAGPSVAAGAAGAPAEGARHDAVAARVEARGAQPPATKRGHEPAKATTRGDSAAPAAVAAESSHPIAPKRPSSTPIIIGILVFVAAAIGGVWFLFLRERRRDQEGRRYARQRR